MLCTLFTYSWKSILSKYQKPLDLFNCNWQFMFLTFNPSSHICHTYPTVPIAVAAVVEEGGSHAGRRINRRGCRVNKRRRQVHRGRGGVQNRRGGWGGWVIVGRWGGWLQGGRWGWVKVDGRIPSCKMPCSVQQQLPRLLLRDAKVLQVLLAQLLNILSCVIPVENKHRGEVLKTHGGEQVSDALWPRDSSTWTCLHCPWLVWMLFCSHINEFKVSLPATAPPPPNTSGSHPHHLNPVSSPEGKRLSVIGRRMAILDSNRLAHHPVPLPSHPLSCLQLHRLLYIGFVMWVVQVVHWPAHFSTHSSLQPSLEGGDCPVGHAPPPWLANHPNVSHGCRRVLLWGTTTWVLPFLPPSWALPQVHLLVLHGVEYGGCQLLAIHSTQQVCPPADFLGQAPFPHKSASLCEVDAPGSTPQHVWARLL